MNSTLTGGSQCAESAELNEPLKALQCVQAVRERQCSEVRYFMHAHPADSKSWHEEFVEAHVVKVTINMDDIQKSKCSVQYYL